jgi:hypothetical protein
MAHACSSSSSVSWAPSSRALNCDAPEVDGVGAVGDGGTNGLERAGGGEELGACGGGLAGHKRFNVNALGRPPHLPWPRARRNHRIASAASAGGTTCPPSNSRYVHVVPDALEARDEPAATGVDGEDAVADARA